jgi:glycosyltransferase involved in cell wall biosynthesis
LPVALLEYGIYKKPVVVTNVGEMASVIQNNHNGIIVPSDDSELFYNSLVKLIENADLRIKFGQNLYQSIQDNHSEKAVMKQYLQWINTL